jgi:hypothetical protein
VRLKQQESEVRVTLTSTSRGQSVESGASEMHLFEKTKLLPKRRPIDREHSEKLGVCRLTTFKMSSFVMEEITTSFQYCLPTKDFPFS